MKLKKTMLLTALALTALNAQAGISMLSSLSVGGLTAKNTSEGNYQRDKLDDVPQIGIGLRYTQNNYLSYDATASAGNYEAGNLLINLTTDNNKLFYAGGLIGAGIVADNGDANFSSTVGIKAGMNIINSFSIELALTHTNTSLNTSYCDNKPFSDGACSSPNYPNYNGDTYNNTSKGNTLEDASGSMVSVNFVGKF